MNEIISQKRYLSTVTGVAYDNLSQSFLRAETALGTTSKIVFNLQKGKTTSNALPTEQLLELNDQFVITHFRVGLKRVGSDTPTDLQQYNSDVVLYDDPSIFTGTNSVNVGSVYNAKLRFTIDRKEYLPTFPVSAFRRVPDTQTADDADYTSSGITTVNSYPNGLFGFYPCEPMLIDGRQTIDLSINFDSSIPFDDSDSINYAVFEARGFLVVNSKD
jgi:hypothetical protein